jgi:DNA-binding winged helix-turn-helix (wHTH) protein/tetratricopeptide (TPR) repeat protein
VDSHSSQEKIARFGRFQVDLAERVLTRKGVRIKLQEKPFQILALLLEHPGEIVTREELKSALWRSDTFVEFDDGLNTAIKKLRVALDDPSDNPVYIETIPRRGYRLLAPVQSQSPDLHVAINAVVPSPIPLAEPSPPIPPPKRPTAWLIASIALAALVSGGVTIWVKGQTHKRSAQVSASQPRDSAHSITPRSVDPQAYEEYVQGRQYWRERTAEALAKAVDHFGRAIDRDPNYAAAYAALANCYVVSPMLSTVPKESAYAKARQAAERALKLDDSVAEAHLAIAEISLYSDWDFPAAEKEFKRALELDSSNAQAHQWYAEFLSLMGRHAEAIAEIQTAEQLDPLAMIIYHQAGQVFQAARQYDKALEQYRRALQILPGFGPTYSAMAIAYRRQGNYPAYLEAERQAGLYWDAGGTSVGDLENVAKAYSDSGERGFLLAMVEFEKKHPRATYYTAWSYAQLGDNEQALHWLQKSFQAREIEILGVQNDPEFDSLRSDPRFQKLVRAIGLTR